MISMLDSSAALVRCNVRPLSRNSKSKTPTRDRHTHGHTHSRDLCVSVCLDRSHEYYVLQQQKRAQAGERGDRDSLFITHLPRPRAGRAYFAIVQ